MNPTVPSPARRTRIKGIARKGILFTALLVAAACAFIAIISSSAFEQFIRGRLIHALEASTGGRVQIAYFHWQPLRLQAEAGGIVVHGLEAGDEAPYARIARLAARVSVLGLVSPRILLDDLLVVQPQFHLIVYPDGATNQPQPQAKPRQAKPALDTFFDLQAGHIAVEQGSVDIEHQAAGFDFQNRHLPLDFVAGNIALRLGYLPASAQAPESYRIDASLNDFELTRQAIPDSAKSNAKGRTQQVHGRVEASIDLMRAGAVLRSMQITATGKDVAPRAFHLTGSLQNFARPRWQARGDGELDLRLLDPITGYPFAPAGIARLDMQGAGESGQFRLDGSVHVADGSYIGTGVIATGVQLDAKLHADQSRLLVTSVVARLRQGGQLEGEVDLSPWLPPVAGAATLRASEQQAPGAAHPRVAAKNSKTASSKWVFPPPSIIPVNGSVKAVFKDVALETILAMVAQPPFQHLGLDTRLNGSTNAVWSGGANETVTVTALLNLTAPRQAAAGTVPVDGVIDGTYTQKNGAVDVRKLALHLPASELEASGRLGAHPLESPTAIHVDFRSANLGEFDAVLRDLGLARNGKSGAAALPIALAGQAGFHGQWAGSLMDPHLSGTAQATQLALEMPATGAAQPSTPQFIHWDSIDATGSYSATQITIDHGVLRQGKSSIALDGSLTAASAAVRKTPTTAFDTNALLRLHCTASALDLDQLLPFAGVSVPKGMVAGGMLDAKLNVSGPLRSLNGAGTAQISDTRVYGEPIRRVSAQGAIDHQRIRLNSFNVAANAGFITGHGTYDLNARRYELDAKGSAVNIAKIDSLTGQVPNTSGILGVEIAGSGSIDNPTLNATAQLVDASFGGEALGNLDLTASVHDHAADYTITTRLATAELVARGNTALNADYPTKAQLDFSHFNIGALLKMAHVQGLSGESALAGTVTIEGPLAHLDQMRGDARLNELAVAVSGVHLRSQGPVHAALANGRFNLDPVHITGEDTDLRLQGGISLKDKRPLDAAASGTINLKIAQSLDPDLSAGGIATFQVEAHGTAQNPGLRGRIDFQNGSLALEDLANGLSQIRGTLVFNQDRLEVKTLTAMSGGGLLSVGGYLAYQRGLYADLTVTGKGIRIRYPEGVSSLADTALQLQGSQSNLLLSGDILITRFSMNPDFDIAALAAQATAAQAVASPDAPSNHIRLDVHLHSSPQLNFQNAFAKLAGNADLRLRGTIASPSLLGRVTVTEGSALIAGTRYDLQHGELSFTNPVRIQPNIDLNATARVEDYDITLGLHGPIDKPSVSYRSDPPLPEADVVALLALGRTENQQRLYTEQQVQSSANPTTDALLGAALNATVSSRVQKLFGAGSVKVDPNYVGALGNSTSRIIVEEQLGRSVTLTYATNVNTTQQQLLQAEVAINRHVSVLVARDESGVFSMVLKATRRYR